MMTKCIVWATFISFALSFAFCKIIIPYLHKVNFGQEIRDDGPKTHLKKKGTPTMGGIAFIVAIIITGIIFAVKYPKIWPIVVVTAVYGFVGFLDDYLKVVRKNTEGLKPKYKLLFQLIIMIGFCVYMMVFSDIRTAIRIPFVGTEVELKWAYPILAFFVMLGTDNGVNFTDGVDGLCSSVTVIVSAFLVIASIKLKADIAPIAAAVGAALLAFLVFNSYPAKVFMGDTGSLALGGFVSSAFLIIGEPILIMIVGFIYFAEILSSIIQVAYFKKTGGKRIFKMAPIHHHFELSGWSETRIVTVFTIATVLLSVIGYVAL